MHVHCWINKVNRNRVKKVFTSDLFLSRLGGQPVKITAALLHISVLQQRYAAEEAWSGAWVLLNFHLYVLLRAEANLKHLPDDIRKPFKKRYSISIPMTQAHAAQLCAPLNFRADSTTHLLCHFHIAITMLNQSQPMSLLKGWEAPQRSIFAFGKC